MTTLPTVSVIIPAFPAYNSAASAAYIANAINSALAQTVVPYEIINQACIYGWTAV